jgi:hypothetical protein
MVNVMTVVVRRITGMVVIVTIRNVVLKATT